MKHYKLSIVLLTILISISPQISVAQIYKQLVQKNRNISASKNGNYPNLLLRLGHQFYQQGEFDKARDYYVEAIRGNPSLADAYYGLGNVFYEQKLFNMAMVAYSKAIKLDPDLADAYYGLGNVFYEQELFDQAVENYDIASNLNPKSYEISEKLSIARKKRSVQKDIPKPTPYNSVVKITYTCSGSHNEGTGWILDKGEDHILIITNRHIFTDECTEKSEDSTKSCIELEFYDSNVNGEKTSFQVTNDVKIFPVPVKKMPDNSPDNNICNNENPADLKQAVYDPDLAILKVINIPNYLNIEALQFSPREIILPTPITVIGYPKIINKLKPDIRVGEIHDILFKNELLEISPVQLYQGNSGSPVLDQKNKVVGIIFEISTPNGTTKGTAGFGVAYSIQFVKDQLLKLEFGL